MTPACPRCGLLHPPGAACFSLQFSAPPAKDDLQAGTVLVGRYRVERILHRGGMGAVYLATDLHDGRPVAVKGLELLDGASPEERHEAEMWFARESFLLSMLRHPLIPAFHGSFRDGGRSYLAQEYVEGENLEALLARQGPLDPIRAGGWAGMLCRLLTYLHELPTPVIFRDLKPANIVLRPDGPRLAVVDFGIARPYAPGVVGTVIGTPGYAPPEQYQGLATPQSDVYALGATLHRLLTGYDPEHGPPFTFPPVRDLNPAVPSPLAAIVARAVRINPTERFASAAEMGAALAHAGYGPVIAAPTAAALRAARARNRRLTWIVAALLGLLLVPSAVILEMRLRPAPTLPAVRGTCVPEHRGHFQGLDSLTRGPDGAIWFVNDGEQLIGRITDDGQITACQPLPKIPHIYSLTTSGNLLWFSEEAAYPVVGYLTTTGQIVTFQLSHLRQAESYAIASGGDGSAWVVEDSSATGMSVAHITPAGGLTEFPLPGMRGYIKILAVSVDGTVWFTGNYSQNIERLDPDGRITRPSLPPSTAFASDSQGTVWYVSGDGSAIGHVSRQGIISRYPFGDPIDPKTQEAGTPTIDESGNLWFAVSGIFDSMQNSMLEITGGGRLWRYPLPEGIYPFPCVAGLGGAIWFPDNNAGKIGRIAPGGSVREYAAVF